MKLSITLPSIHSEALNRTLNNLRDTTRCDYEVLVVSPDPPPPFSEVFWVEDFIMEGCNAGHALGLAEAKGDFVFPWVDDHLMVEGWDVLAISEFCTRELLTRDRPFMLGLRQVTDKDHLGHVGTCFGIYYPYFPLMRTADARRIGWFRPEYRVGFGDIDLAMRVWVNGGRVEWSENEYTRAHADDGENKLPGKLNYTNDDMRLFLERWRSIYGKNWKYGDSNIRDFNRDVPMSTYEMRRSNFRTFSPEYRAFC